MTAADLHIIYNNCCCCFVFLKAGIPRRRHGHRHRHEHPRRLVRHAARFSSRGCPLGMRACRPTRVPYTFTKLHDRRINNVCLGVRVGPMEFQLKRWTKTAGHFLLKPAYNACIDTGDCCEISGTLLASIVWLCVCFAPLVSDVMRWNLVENSAESIECLDTVPWTRIEIRSTNQTTHIQLMAWVHVAQRYRTFTHMLRWDEMGCAALLISPPGMVAWRAIYFANFFKIYFF